MPTITIYLTNELYDKVRDAPSKTVRAALEHYFGNAANKSTETSKQPQHPVRECDKKHNTPKDH